MSRRDKENEAGGAGIGGYCRDMRAGMAENCPCGSFVRRHRLGVYTALVVTGIGALVVPLGWVLGVIAFFRTF